MATDPMDLRQALFRWLALALRCALRAHCAFAQTDEIQVYNAEIAAPGVFNLTLHDNYSARRPHHARPSPVASVPNHTLNGVPEWAYGVADLV